MMLRLAKRESQFDSGATSGAGAKGLFQLTDITIKQIIELDLKFLILMTLIKILKVGLYILIGFISDMKTRKIKSRKH